MGRGLRKAVSIVGGAVLATGIVIATPVVAGASPGFGSPFPGGPGGPGGPGRPGGPGGPGRPGETVYVSPTPSRQCPRPAFSTISAVVAAARSGGTIVVCSGTYHEDVVVTAPVTIIGRGATVDPGTAGNSPLAAALGNNAFTVLAPNVSISGFTVTGASGDGILAAGNHANLSGNLAEGNGGTGIDLNGSSWSTVSGNTAVENTGGGYYLTNDVGGSPQFAGHTASHDLIVRNRATDNPGGCGVILADHLGAPSGANTAQGIFDNTVTGNVLEGNGTVAAGAGVVLASPVPGGAVFDNTVTGNTLSGNGLGGVTLHSHLPGQYLGGNRVIGNNIGTNNVVGDYGDPLTTGVYVGSVSPVSITVTSNSIHGNAYGIFTAGPVTVAGQRLNAFFGDGAAFGSIPGYAG